MAKGLSYTDAVKILGGSGPMGKVADNLLGGLLSVATAGGSDFALSFFDAKAEMVRLGGLIKVKFDDLVRGLGRYERSERLLAAHGVLVVTALFEGFDDCFRRTGLEPAEFTRDDQLLLVNSQAGRHVAARLLDTPLPVPSPTRSYAVLLDDVRVWSQPIAEILAIHVTGLAVWDAADETTRARVEELISNWLPDRTTELFDESYRRLAADIPEFAIWSGSLTDRATAHSLQRLESLLLRASSGRDPSRHRAALARAYRAKLTRPVLDGEVGDLILPDFGDAYVDPRFQVRVAGAGSRPSDEAWWDGTARDDIHDFLATYLTTTDAARTPLLLLGQPGAGKSTLTHILAARLPASDYLVARVPLREVPADADIQHQVELAVRAAIGETVAWAELAEDAGRPLSVVLLDGFDELLQATGLHQSDYLQRVAAFQERELAQNRPVAVVVTSRSAVADRARIPQGSMVVRLEPFDESQIEQWLRVWNGTNPSNEPLRPESLARLRDLAGQPLLLLMLALHHAAGNRLADDLDGAGLYERLLRDFAAREVSRVHAGRADQERHVEEELQRLSVVAFAMFHRNHQWVTERELDDDLAGLGLEPSGTARTERFTTPLTAAQEMVGRFFFVQRSRAIRDDKTLQTYEFLHATFGEYLVARLVVQALRDTTARERAATLSLGSGRQPESDLLQDLLGYTPLTARNTVLQFARSLLGTPDRADVREFLVRRTRRALTWPTWSPGAYRPVEKRIDHGMATYSFNLVLLTLVCGDELRASELFTESAEPADELRDAALQWRGALGSLWLDSMEHLSVRWHVHDGRRDRVLSYGSAPHAPLDPRWSTKMRGLASFDWLPALTSMTLSNNLSDDTVLHALEPLIRRLPDAARYFVANESGQVESVANCLVELWLTSTLGPEPKTLEAAYDRAVAVLYKCEDTLGTEAESMLTMMLRMLRGDLERLDPDAVLLLLDRLGSAEAAIASHYAELTVLQLHPHLASTNRRTFSNVFSGNYLTGTDEFGPHFVRRVAQWASEADRLADLVHAVVAMEGTPENRGLTEVVREFDPDLARLLTGEKPVS